MQFCVSGDSCVWAPFLLSQAHLTIWAWGRLCSGVGWGLGAPVCHGSASLV